MTWSLSNTVTYTTDADNHTALVYLFDTALNGFTNWTVSAHPDASAFKRTIKRTTTTLYGGGSYDEHFWVNWSSTSPTTMNMYEDATYTTVPGDLGTDTTNSVSFNIETNVDTLDWKFWTSDQNANALLVTRGKAIIFWEPGYSSAALMEDSTWTGASDSRRTQIFPANRDFYPRLSGYEDAISGADASTYVWMVGVGNKSGSGYRDAERFDMNVPFMALGGTNNTPTTGARFLFPGVGNDTGAYRPASSSSTNNAYQNGTSNQGQLVLANTNYYLTSYNSLDRGQLAFLFGASEPDFS